MANDYESYSYLIPPFCSESATLLLKGIGSFGKLKLTAIATNIKRISVGVGERHAEEGGVAYLW